LVKYHQIDLFEPDKLRNLLVITLQTSDANKVVTPEGWQPRDKVIVPPPATTEAAEARVNEGYECTDWYFCKKVA
jgi:peroxiredoxin (alkyl hydroperoxide reductase subunit C)